jgi:hypothetical protein
MQKPHPHAPKRLQYAWEHEQHLKDAHPAEYARLQNSGELNELSLFSWAGGCWSFCPELSKNENQGVLARRPVGDRDDCQGGGFYLCASELRRRCA